MARVSFLKSRSPRRCRPPLKEQLRPERVVKWSRKVQPKNHHLAQPVDVVQAVEVDHSPSPERYQPRNEPSTPSVSIASTPTAGDSSLCLHSVGLPENPQRRRSLGTLSRKGVEYHDMAAFIEPCKLRRESRSPSSSAQTRLSSSSRSVSPVSDTPLRISRLGSKRDRRHDVGPKSGSAELVPKSPLVESAVISDVEDVEITSASTSLFAPILGLRPVEDFDDIDERLIGLNRALMRRSDAEGKMSRFLDQDTSAHLELSLYSASESAVASSQSRPCSSKMGARDEATADDNADYEEMCLSDIEEQLGLATASTNEASKPHEVHSLSRLLPVGSDGSTRKRLACLDDNMATPQGEVADLLEELAANAELFDPRDYWTNGAWDLESLREDASEQRMEANALATSRGCAETSSASPERMHVLESVNSRRSPSPEYPLCGSVHTLSLNGKSPSVASSSSRQLRLGAFARRSWLRSHSIRNSALGRSLRLLLGGNC